jgi:hypothetical protein
MYSVIGQRLMKVVCSLSLPGRIEIKIILLPSSFIGEDFVFPKDEYSRFS